MNAPVDPVQPRSDSQGLRAPQDGSKPKESRWTQHFLVREANRLDPALFAQVVAPDFVRWLRERHAAQAQEQAAALAVPRDGIRAGQQSEDTGAGAAPRAGEPV